MEDSNNIKISQENLQNQQYLSSLDEKSKLINVVNQKIKAVIDLRKKVKNCSEQSDEAFEKDLYYYFELLIQQFPKETQVQFRQKREKLQKYNEIKSQIDEYLDSFEHLGIVSPCELTPKDIEQFTQEEKEELENWTELEHQSFMLRMFVHSNFKPSDNLDFLFEIEKFIEKMVQKKRETSEIMNSGEVRQKIEDMFTNSPYSNVGDFSKIVNGGIDINLIYSSEKYTQIFDSRSQGLHFSETVINAVKDIPGKESIINHENNHTLSETFTSTFYVERLLGLLQAYVEMYLDHGENYATEEELFSKINNEISNYWKANYGEIIADIDNIPNGKLNTFWAEYKQSNKKLRGFLKNLFSDTQFTNSVTNSDKYLQKISITLQELEYSFKQYLNDISDIFFVANRIGKSEETKALFFVFANDEDRIRKIKRHLQSYETTNNITYDDYVFLRSVIESRYDEMHFEDNNMSTNNKVLKYLLGIKNTEFKADMMDIENLKRLQNISDRFSKKDKQALINTFTSDSFEIFSPKHISMKMAIENISIYESVIKKIGFSNYQEHIYFLKEKLFAIYYYYYLKTGEADELIAAFLKNGYNGFLSMEVVQEIKQGWEEVYSENK